VAGIILSSKRVMTAWYDRTDIKEELGRGRRKKKAGESKSGSEVSPALLFLDPRSSDPRLEKTVAGSW